MATTSPLLAVPLPVSTDTDQVPADLMTAFSFAEKFSVGRFPSVAARSAAIPSPVAGMVSYVTTDGWHTYYDGSIWRPFSGQRVGYYSPSLTGTQTVVNPGDVLGFTNGVNLTTLAYPTRVEMSWSCYIQGGIFSTDNVDIGVSRNGAGALFRQRIIGGSGSTTAAQASFDVAASTVTALQGMMVKANGTNPMACVADPSLTWLQVTVLAQ